MNVPYSLTDTADIQGTSRSTPKKKSKSTTSELLLCVLLPRKFQKNDLKRSLPEKGSLECMYIQYIIIINNNYCIIRIETNNKRNKKLRDQSSIITISDIPLAVNVDKTDETIISETATNDISYSGISIDLISPIFSLDIQKILFTGNYSATKWR